MNYGKMWCVKILFYGKNTIFGTLKYVQSDGKMSFTIALHIL